MPLHQGKARTRGVLSAAGGQLAAKRKPEKPVDTTTLDSLKQMRQDDDAVYQSLHSICRGC